MIIFRIFYEVSSFDLDPISYVYFFCFYFSCGRLFFHQLFQGLIGHRRIFKSLLFVVCWVRSLFSITVQRLHRSLIEEINASILWVMLGNILDSWTDLSWTNPQNQIILFNYALLFSVKFAVAFEYSSFIFLWSLMLG